jgi:hypothetical protein
MGRKSGQGAHARTTPAFRALPVIFGALALVGIASTIAFSPMGAPSVHGTLGSFPSAQNSSSGGDPSGSGDSALCPSGGPTILGVQWNCVAILNLTELALILASVGIVAYVFKDEDEAELPGESADVPVTAEEWEAYQKARKLGIPYHPPGPQEGEEER